MRKNYRACGRIAILLLAGAGWSINPTARFLGLTATAFIGARSVPGAREVISMFQKTIYEVRKVQAGSSALRRLFFRQQKVRHVD